MFCTSFHTVASNQRKVELEAILDQVKKADDLVGAPAEYFPRPVKRSARATASSRSRSSSSGSLQRWRLIPVGRSRALARRHLAVHHDDIVARVVGRRRQLGRALRAEQGDQGLRQHWQSRVAARERRLFRNGQRGGAATRDGGARRLHASRYLGGLCGAGRQRRIAGAQARAAASAAGRVSEHRRLSGVAAGVTAGGAHVDRRLARARVGVARDARSLRLVAAARRHRAVVDDVVRRALWHHSHGASRRRQRRRRERRDRRQRDRRPHTNAAGVHLHHRSALEELCADRARVVFGHRRAGGLQNPAVCRHEPQLAARDERRRRSCSSSEFAASCLLLNSRRFIFAYALAQTLVACDIGIRSFHSFGDVESCSKNRKM
jgi:hypothetical protein